LERIQERTLLEMLDQVRDAEDAGVLDLEEGAFEAGWAAGVGVEFSTSERAARPRACVKAMVKERGGGMASSHPEKKRMYAICPVAWTE
jgi:hypothetical protein